MTKISVENKIFQETLTVISWAPKKKTFQLFKVGEFLTVELKV